LCRRRGCAPLRRSPGSAGNPVCARGYPALINRSRELHRERKKEQHTIIVDELAAEISVSENFERLDLEQAIAALPNGYRQILVLHDIEGYTHQEISRLLEIEIGTSKSQLSHARHAVRNSLQALITGNTMRRK